MLELRMDTDLQAALPAEIGFNFEELKTELAERLEHYRSLVVTEDSIKEAKADRAKLNKLRTAIDTRRKDIKAEYLKPYNAFEGKIKELTLLIDEPIKVIDSQLNGFEDRRKEAKKQQIQAAYEARIPDAVKEIIPLERIFDKRWLNVSVTMAKIDEDMEGWAKRVNADLLALDTIEDAYKAACREKYIATLDVSATLAHMQSLKAAEEAFRAREEARKQQAEERHAQEAERAPEAKPEPQEAPPEPIAPPETPTAPKLYTLRLEFHLTREQALALRRYIDDNNIQYNKI